MTDTQKKSQVAALTDIMLEDQNLDRFGFGGTLFMQASLMSDYASLVVGTVGMHERFPSSQALKDMRILSARLGAMAIRFLENLDTYNSRAANNRVSAPGAAQEDGASAASPN